MGRSVFVTGGSGLLGVNWATTAREHYAVTLGVHDRVVDLRGVTTRPTDLEAVDALTRAIGESAAFLVVHTAGITNVEACQAEPAMARHVNVDLAVNVATACAREGVACAHISTDHLFGGEHGAVAETDPVSPTNVYGDTKAEAERRVLETNPDALVVRTNFYGWGPRYRQSFSDTIVESLRCHRPVTLFRDIFYSPILMEALITTVHELVDRGAKGIYHVVGDDHVSKLEFGIRLAERFGLADRSIVPGSIADRPDLAARPRKMQLSNAKATALLGRRLGGLTEQLDRLRGQEGSDAVREIRSL